MATVSPDAAQGKALFFETQSFESHDDLADKKDSGGTYDHSNFEWSATEAEQYADWMRFVNTVLLSGAGGVLVRNTSGGTYAAGTVVYISGYDTGESRFLITKSDADDITKPPQLVMDASLATATNGVAYPAFDVTGLNTDAATVGDPVYLSATAGAWTLTTPIGTSYVWPIGTVTVKSATVGVIRFYPASARMRTPPEITLTGATGQLTEIKQSTTLKSTLSGATVTATSLIPAGSMVVGITARVTTLITGATTFDIGVSGAVDLFGDAIAVAKDTTTDLTDTKAATPMNATAAVNVLLTANGSDFTAGAVRLTVHYIDLTASTS